MYTQHIFRQRTKKGFTLIELLVVIAIIGMLASIVLVSLGPAREKARDVRRKSDIRQILLAMELCYDESACGAKEQYLSTPAGANTVSNISSYMSSVPQDPSNTAPQQYTWISNAGNLDQFCVYTKLENETGIWVAASAKGMRLDLTAAPISITCW